MFSWLYNRNIAKDCKCIAYTDVHCFTIHILALDITVYTVVQGFIIHTLAQAVHGYIIQILAQDSVQCTPFKVL